MTRKNLLNQLSYLVIFIFLVNYLSFHFYWYTSMWFFDMPMHFLGGFWLGLVFLWFFWPYKALSSYILKIIFAVLAIGVAWELFEYVFYTYVAQNPFNAFDTLSDICFDLAGGLTAIYYISKRIMPALKSNV